MQAKEKGERGGKDEGGGDTKTERERCILSEWGGGVETEKKGGKYSETQREIVPGNVVHPL